jgi:hypothetical protein
LRALPISQRAAEIRYNVNWQWTAVKMQYERLMARKSAQSGDLAAVAVLEHMRGIVDLDFLIMSVRRLLRVAEQARGSGCDINADLREPIKRFHGRWRHVIEVRNTLEHVDGSGIPIVPVQSSDPEGRWLFLTPGNQINAQELYEDAEGLCKIICKVISPYEK